MVHLCPPFTAMFHPVTPHQTLCYFCRDKFLNNKRKQSIKRVCVGGGGTASPPHKLSSHYSEDALLSCQLLQLEHLRDWFYFMTLQIFSLYIYVVILLKVMFSCRLPAGVLLPPGVVCPCCSGAAVSPAASSAAAASSSHTPGIDPSDSYSVFSLCCSVLRGLCHTHVRTRVDGCVLKCGSATVPHILPERALPAGGFPSLAA